MQKLVFRNANGIELDLTKGDFGITEWEGFSADDLNIQSQQVPFQDGAVFLDALITERELSVTVAMQDNNDLEKRYRLRRQMISALNPKLGEGVLIYTNDFLSKQIHCIPQLPVFENHNSNDSGTPKASCTFTACNPYWEDLEDTVVELGITQMQNIENEGDVPTQVEMELLTYNAENPTIFNMSTGKKIELNGVIDQNVLINTNMGKKEVIAENIKYDNVSIYGGSNKTILFVEKLSMFVVCSSSTILHYSYDGFHWEYITADIPVTNIDYAENISKFVIASSDGKMYLSSDLKKFTEAQSLPDFPTNVTVNNTCVYYCKDTEKLFSLFINIATGNVLIYSSDDGISWTKSSVSSYFIWAVAMSYNPTSQIYTIIGNSNNYYVTSTDGITWTAREFEDFNITLEDIIYNPILDKTIAVGKRTTGVVGYSSDGIDFTFIDVQTENSASIDAIACNTQNGMMVACQRKTVYISTDMTTWVSEQISEQNLGLDCIAYSDILDGFVCGGINGFLYTYENSVWVKTFEGMSSGMESIFYSDIKGLYVALGEYKYLYTSEDGITNWNRIETGKNTTFYKMLYNEQDNIYIVTAEDGIYYSDGNFSVWTKAVNSGTSQIMDIIYSRVINKYIAITGDSIKISQSGNTWSSYSVSGEWRCLCDDTEHSRIIVGGMTIGNQIATSSDGTHWTYVQTDLGSNERMLDLIYDDENKLYIANISYRTIKVSKDLSSWTTVFTYPSTNTNLSFGNLKKIEGLIYILGSLIATSINGKDWKVVLSYSLGLRDIIYRDKKYYTAGNRFIGYSSYEQADSLIEHLTQDSDISFNLQVGENQLRLTRQEGNISCYVKFRQKYIGV